MARFGQVLTAMVTPFHEDGSLDLDGAATLARWLVDQGNDGLVVAGTTGEAPTLSDAEKLDLWAAVTEAVTVPVVAGTTSNDTRHSVELTEAASKLPIAGVLVQTPYYNRPSQAGIEAHVAAVAEATSLPVMIYDIPVRAGRKMETDTIVRAASITNVVALKDAAGNPGATARVVHESPVGFEVYSGDDAMTLPLMAVGAVGVVGVATHWTAGIHRNMFENLATGDWTTARSFNASMLDSYAFVSTDACPSPGPTKALLRVLGLPAGPCRLPMGPEPAEVEPAARALVAELGLAAVEA